MSRFALVLLLMLGAASPAGAQFTERASQPWRTVETEHFTVHFPEPLSEWALPIIARLEPVRDAVMSAVGSAPSQRVTVVLDDPITIANGLAFSDLNAPVLLFLATPPGPRSQIGDSRNWGELLAVHEFTHLAHLTRPSRNPLRRLIGRFYTGIGPLATRTPRWVKEGYATYIEGKLTGSGRPHGAWRAAYLRQWALEGKLPSYAGLNSLEGYDGGSFAYLAGSAYLEWLAAQRGDSSLVHLWRRLSARKNRNFVSAFKGVYGATPDELYGRFQVDVTARALEARERLEAAGLIEGETYQAFDWDTGDPAVSRDGKHMAVVLRARRKPSRVVVWDVVEAPRDSARDLKRAQRARERDPEDVPDIIVDPPGKKPIATLHPASGGRAHDLPRFLPDGERILLVRFEPVADGSLKPDLFIWNYKRDAVRRITHGAGIVAADAEPNGRSAVGVQCRWGKCGLVRVDLESGALTTLVAGTVDVTFNHPRVSPDGRWVAVAAQRNGKWRTELHELGGSAVRVVGPDDGVERYDAAFVADGAALIVVSEAGAVLNLERIDLATNTAVPLTRVTGAATAPEPAADGTVYFLRLHARGLDLARIDGRARAGATVALDSTLAPAAPLGPVSAPSFSPLATAPVTAYGLGDRQYRWSPVFGWGRGGLIGGFYLSSTDPVGRLSWLLQTRFGGSEWSGGSLRTALRRFTPLTIEADVFGARQRLLRSDDAPFATPELDATFRGGWSALAVARNTGSSSARLRLGGSIGTLDVSDGAVSRRLASGDVRLFQTRTLGAAHELSVGLNAHLSAGITDDADWTREVYHARLVARRRSTPGFGVALDATRGRVNGSAGIFENFLVGGDEPRFFDPAILSQRRTLPAIPAGVLGGRRLTEAKAQLTGTIFGPYFWAASVDRDLENWIRVVGIEQEIEIPPIPLFRLTGSRTTLGLGYSLDEPTGKKLRFYSNTSLRP